MFVFLRRRGRDAALAAMCLVGAASLSLATPAIAGAT